MEKEIQNEFQELSNLETAGSLDETQQSRLSVLKMVDAAEKTATQKSKDLDSALAQKEHFRTKFEELEKKQKEPKSNEGIEEWTASKDPLEVVKLGKVLKDYDEQETEFIIKNAPSKDIDGIIKAEKDEMVQFAIKSRREKATKENKVPSPSGSSGGFSEKSAQEIEKLSRDDHKKYWKEQQERQASEGI